MNPQVAAVGIAFIVGILVIPWNITLQKMSSGQFFVIFGITCIVGGLLQMLKTGNRPFTGIGLAWGILTAIIYFVAIAGCNYIYGHPQARLPILAAITAGYPLITAIFSAILKRQMMSPKELLFLCMGVAGIVGLGLTKQT